MATFSAPEHQLDADLDVKQTPTQDSSPAPADAEANASNPGITENWLAQLLPDPDAAGPADAANEQPAITAPEENSRIEPSVDSYPRVDLLQRISPEPIALNRDAQYASRSSARRIGGLLSCAALLVLLAFQWWAKDPLRWPALATVPVVNWACNYYPCQLQAAYLSEQLAVYSHPEKRGVLIVEAVLSNTSAVAQPFPQLALKFTDADDRPVAQRRFSPGEYLRGEASGASKMAPATPVRIALTIQDPGPSAVNYTLQLLSQGSRS